MSSFVGGGTLEKNFLPNTHVLSGERSYWSTSFVYSSDQEIDCGNDSSLRILVDLSVFFWVKSAPITGTNLDPAGRFDSTDRSWLFWADFPTNPFNLSLFATQAGAGNQKLYQPSIDVADNDWHYLGFTFAANDLKIYVDGAEDTSVTKLTDQEVNAVYDSAEPVRFGWSSECEICKAIICDTTVLSAANIASLYNGGLQLNPTTLSLDATIVSYWPLGDGDKYPNAYDRVGTNHGTMVNMSQSSFTKDVP